MRKPIIALISIALIGVGCGSKNVAANGAPGGSGGQAPEDFLKWSMDQYHHAKSFSTTEDFKIDSLAFGMKGERKRTFTYQSPNLYKTVVTLLPAKVQITCVSDGTKETAYSSDNHAKAMSSTAPTAIQNVESAPMVDPTICGSVLYYFFAGSENIGQLEKQGDEKATWGAEGTAPNGEPTKTVRFLASGVFGHTEVTIGTKTGLVYKAVFDSLPEVERFLKGRSRQALLDEIKSGVSTMPKGHKKDFNQKVLDTGPSAFDITCVETFDNPTFDATIQTASFRPDVPAGEKFAPPPPDGKAPVAIGAKAPDITVNDDSGRPVKLSSLRGHVVILDFWATWCEPCKEAMPVNVALTDKYKEKGLRMMAVSSEPPATVTSFVKQQSYKIPAYTDPQQAATYAYHVNALPTTVIIDPQGNLSDFITGLTQPAELQAALLRAGLKP